MYLDEFETSVPYDALNYLTAECNYGGRVTDKKDRITIVTILKGFFCESVLNDPAYKFAMNEIYKAPGL